MEDEKLISKLWKVSRTAHEMVQDRGFAVSQQEIEIPYAEFKETYAGNGIIDRASLHFFASLEDNPDDQIFVFFADEPSIGIKTMRKFLTVLEERKIGRGILIYPEKLTPAANKVTFTESELQVNITHHQLVPQHEVLTAEEKKLLLQKYRLKPTQLPRILTSDPVARYFGLERGQVVKIIRPSETSGRYASYRICF
ncbi:RPB5 subunit of DNA-directed RNA polymerase [Wallemia mellicola]|uniref:DNA-directed RNA polymerases I, II, and III subunit RPABC1 n=1 Tax=Wallemia mellicola TaxID=1708541 RepID=A0A4T0NER1_9BASI|nr:RPB5 subunit of DNA-directed RNA polymerase [Wallemia mellicola]TIC05046.1 RPB5 subunit of DNA-directed RNA polymerase [Wallemia mellicola]TIC08197.1 RPB5 subunit of DNA-directed RNA polymerase [Wallemia mellicola]TIC15059.1 RPB5 subunit of DNA-directed RNA polymerase [Wallemia mellicola]TIC18290.1 RPB5 subunit of DNA-directed RNA polymerase [Wallemia mellicola]